MAGCGWGENVRVQEGNAKKAPMNAGKMLTPVRGTHRMGRLFRAQPPPKVDLGASGNDIGGTTEWPALKNA